MARYVLSFRLLAAIGLFYLLLSSCAVLEKGPSPAPESSVPQKPGSPVYPYSSSAVYDPGPVIKKAKDEMAKGQYEKALEECKGALSLHPGDKRLLSGCREALLVANAAAEASFAKKDFAKAGGLYYLVMDNYRLLQTRALKHLYLEKRIKDCGIALTEKGLESYRKGSLQEAIAQWEEVLKFEPGNSEVKKAVDTARLQLKNLSK